MIETLFIIPPPPKKKTWEHSRLLSGGKWRNQLCHVHTKKYSCGGHELTPLRAPAGVSTAHSQPQGCPSGSTVRLLMAASSRWYGRCNNADLCTPSTGNSSLRTHHWPAWNFPRTAVQCQALPNSPCILLSITGIRPTGQSKVSPYLPWLPFLYP